MAATGGSIESLTLDGRTFPVAGDAEAQRKLGGFENEQQPNGDGLTSRLIKTRVSWKLDGVAVEIDDDRSDLEFLQELADRFSNFPVSITYASGVVNQGVGQLTGEFPASSQNATAPVTLEGPGKLTQQ